MRKRMTREDAIAEAKRRQESDPDASWIATSRDGEWTVVRIGVAPIKVTGTATKPPPVAPRDDPHSPIERAAWFAGARLSSGRRPSRPGSSCSSSRQSRPQVRRARSCHHAQDLKSPHYARAGAKRRKTLSQTSR
jgi:hypothetical protein